MATAAALNPQASLLHFKVITSDQFAKVPLLKADPKPRCAICFEDFVENSNPNEGIPIAYHSSASTIHAYHFTCISNWFLFDTKNNYCCPLCTQAVDVTKFFNDVAEQFLSGIPNFALVPAAVDLNPGHARQAQLLAPLEQAEFGLAEVTTFIKNLLSELAHFSLIIMGGVCVAGLLGPLPALGFLIFMVKSFAEQLRQKYNF